MRSIAVILILTLASLAFADEEKALELYEQGFARLDAGKETKDRKHLEAAIEALTKALALDPGLEQAPELLQQAKKRLAELEEE